MFQIEIVSGIAFATWTRIVDVFEFAYVVGYHSFPYSCPCPYSCFGFRSCFGFDYGSCSYRGQATLVRIRARGHGANEQGMAKGYVNVNEEAVGVRGIGIENGNGNANDEAEGENVRRIDPCPCLDFAFGRQKRVVGKDGVVG